MKKKDNKSSEVETARRRDETIKRMLSTPPLKHTDEKHPRKNPAKKKAAKRKGQS
jgi:hypothetical protein